jgi:YVTN family beta-propeller protein
VRPVRWLLAALMIVTLPACGSSRSSGLIVTGHRPYDVLAAHDSVWVANLGSGTVSRIDPHRRRVVATIAVDPEPDGLVPSAEGVWVTSLRAHSLELVDARSNTVERRVDASAAAPDGQVQAGDVWVGGLLEDHVTAFDPVSGAVHASRAVRGAAWTADDGTSTWVGSVTNRTLVRIDDASGDTLAVTRLPDAPSRIAVTATTVWVASFEGRAVHALDLETGTLRQTFKMPGRPKGIATAGGRVVVSGHTPGLLPRRVRWLDPRRGEGFLLVLADGPFRPGRPRRISDREGALAITGSTVWIVDVDRGGVRPLRL